MSVNTKNRTFEPPFMFGNTTIQLTSYPGYLLYLCTLLRGNSKLMLTKMVFVSIKTIFIQSEKCLYSSGKISQYLLILPQCCHKRQTWDELFYFFALSLHLKEYDPGREVSRIYNALTELFIAELFFHTHQGNTFIIFSSSVHLHFWELSRNGRKWGISILTWQPGRLFIF